MKRIFSVVTALMLILSTTSQAMVVTINGQNCTYTMTSPANREITVNDTKGNVKWWEVKDTSNNIIGVIDGRFVTPTSDVTVTPMLKGNQIVVQQTANGSITYEGNTVNTVQWYEDTSSVSYEFTITPNSGYEIETIKVNGQEKSVTNQNQMTYTFTNEDINTTSKNQVITATYVVATTPAPEPEPTTYTITYDLNGGTNNESNPTSYTVETDDIALNQPTKSGHTFIGWTGANGTTAQIGITIPQGSTGDKTYTANWLTCTDTSEANTPVIADGLTPVNWSEGEEKWVAASTSWDYNYLTALDEDGNEASGESDVTVAAWANAQTADGSLYVWIPRYTYTITSGEHQDVDSWNADSGDNKTGKIEIKFSNGTTDYTDNDTPEDTTDDYLTHPAFTFGTEETAEGTTKPVELKGIWVAKYEASRNDATYESAGSGTKVSSKPGVVSWRIFTVSSAFSYAYNLNRSLDSHLMKNVEWGAVAYLTNAIGRIPYINNSSSYITGNAGEKQNASSSDSTYAWSTEQGVKASTTHNVYGIYDLSGGAQEYVAAYVNNGNSSLTNYASKLVNSYSNYGTKYVDVYTIGTSDSSTDNYEAWSDIKGDAVYETSSSNSGLTSWDGDTSIVPYTSHITFFRGGSYAGKSSAGIFRFESSSGSGSNVSHHGFRPVLAIR